MAQVIWTDAALGDLANVFEYMAKSMSSFERAEAFCLDLTDHAKSRLGALPKSGALVHDLLEWHAREIFRHAYRIIYVQRGDARYVNMLIHSSRDLAIHLDRARWENIP